MSERRPGDESGAVLVLVALMLPVLLAAAGIALDLGHWFLAAQREQKAADAAALAGAIYLPGTPPTAIATATDLARRNGFANDADTKVVVTQEPKPSRLRVTVTQNRKNFFGAFLGLTTTKITRTAVAEFQGPVPMGSPANTFGSEPLGGNDTQRWSTVFTTPATQPLFWANVAGPGSPKRNGDAHQAGVCTAGDDGCSGSVNDDYSPNGYFYAVRVPTPPAGKKLSIQVFDPAFVAVGDHCTDHLASATASTNPFVTDAATRYASGDGPFCTGDVLFGAPVTTTFVVRAPSPTPWDPLSGAVVSTGTCRPVQYPGFDLDLAAPLKDPGGDANLQQWFRRWVPVCDIDTPVAGDYLLQVRTNVRFGSSPTGPADTSTPGSGHNRFAIRAGFVDGAGVVSGSGVRIFATTTMAIYANNPASTTQFYLVRLPSGSGGRVLVLSFFDVGDADTGTLRVVPPPDYSSTPFSSCTGEGPRVGALTNCALATNPTDFQGRWERVRVPIPSGYTCNDGDPKGCWVRVEYNYSGGAQDTTTWSASIEGDPVRLVE